MLKTFEMTSEPVQFSDTYQTVVTDMKNGKHSVETQQLFRQILKREKNENLFLLSGGVAHNFNNILTIIQGFTELIYEDLPAESPLREFVNDIFKSIDRGAEITRQLLICAGESVLKINPVDLSHLVSEMICLIKYSMPEKVTLKYDLSENLPAIDVDVTQIRRIIMNLITNASEAIVGEGVITLKSGVVECSHLYLSEAYGHENLSGGTYVYLEVSDTGCGINKEIKDKIFEPFFTTKFFGRGLGLSEVSGIMRAHHGAIMVYNEPGHNTTFRLIFPLAGKTLTEHSKLVTGDIVLVVDDEMSARKMAKTSLERAGFHVITASDGFKAIELLKAYSDMVKVVLLDMDMPQMNGEETFHRLKDISNDVRVIIAMECNDQRIYRQFIDDGVYGFIQKPCRVKDLVEVIYKAVDDYSENMNLNQ